MLNTETRFLIQSLTNSKFESSGAKESRSMCIGNTVFNISLDGLVDKTLLQKQLNAEKLKVNTELDKLTSQLQNTAFMANAPKPLIHKLQLRATELHNKLANLN